MCDLCWPLVLVSLLRTGLSGVKVVLSLSQGPQFKKALCECDSQQGVDGQVVSALDVDHIHRAIVGFFVMITRRAGRRVIELYRKTEVLWALNITSDQLVLKQFFHVNDHAVRAAIPGVGWAAVLEAARACDADRLAAAANADAAASSASTGAAPQPAAAVDVGRSLLQQTVDVTEKLWSFPANQAAMQEELDERGLDSATELGQAIYRDNHVHLVENQLCYDKDYKLYKFPGGPELLLGTDEMTVAHQVVIRGPLAPLCSAAGGSQAELAVLVEKYSKAIIVEAVGGGFEETPQTIPDVLALLGIIGTADSLEADLLDRLGLVPTFPQHLALFARGGPSGTGPGTGITRLVFKARRLSLDS